MSASRSILTLPWTRSASCPRLKLLRMALSTGSAFYYILKIKFMLGLIMFFMTMLCTNPKPHVPGGPNCNGIHVIISGPDGDTGGETGNPPPPPPPPPPHG